MAYTAEDTHPPWRFLYLRETKCWSCEEDGGGGEGGEGEGGGEGGEENVSMLTHTTARGMGKNKCDGA